MNPSRRLIAEFVETRRFQNAITAVILVNAVFLGLETSPTIMATVGPAVVFLDSLCLLIFVLEILVKLYAFRLSFFRSGWNVFDFVIVAISLVPWTHSFTVLRALRILRLLRLVSVTPTLRRVVEGFLRAVPGMGSVFLMLAMIFYIGAVMATKLFGEAFPEWFGTIGRSAYSLFQIMTLESWSMGIVRPVMAVYPYAWAFFIPFIMMTTFAVVNLLVGLIVNSMQEAHNAEANAATDVFREEVLERLRRIEAQLTAREAPKGTASVDEARQP